MKLQGERIIPASVERTWTELNDPQTLKACIAGCESIETTGDNQFLVTLAVRIGPVNAKFKGKLQLTDIVPMQSYRINFDGQGGVAGFGKGAADVTLAPEGDADDATRLSYTADAQVGGKIAQIGSRLVESAAAKIADDFFKAFEARMTTPTVVAEAADSTHSPASADSADAAPSITTATESAQGAAMETSRPPATVDANDRAADVARGNASGGSSIWWIAGIIVVALLIYFFTR